MNSEIEIPGFNLLRPLGRSASAEVYLAEQISPSRQVALKLVPLKPKVDEKFVKGLQDDGEIATRFTHQNLVTVYACGVAEHHYYLAMEYLSGGDLAARMEAGLDQEQIIAICRDMAGGLGYIHQRDAVHGNIKPANVMFNDDGRVVLVDSGIARLETADSSLTSNSLRSGTLVYMSPEQVQGKQMDGRSDLYSLGVILYEMLTGHTPFRADPDVALTYSYEDQHPQPLPVQYGHFQCLITKMIDKQPSRRFANAEALVAALDGLQQSGQQGVVNTDSETGVIKQTSQSWWHEMQQRRVFRAAAIYIVLAWGFTEISTTVLEGFNAPQWIITTILVLFVSGFPVAILLAWLFEIGPGGMRRTPPASRRGIFAIMMSVTLLATSASFVLWFPDSGDTTVIEPSVQSIAIEPVVAVLPFRDMSTDQSQAFLGDGLAEELLNRLAQAGGIRTIGRTSSFLLAQQGLSIAEIAAKLNADLIVEGGIRQQGKQLIISVSLIDPDSGQTQWSDSYQQVMANVFDVQEQIAKAVVSEITGVQNVDVTAGRIGTNNPQAYQLYLRAHHRLFQAVFNDEETARKRELLNQAIDLDPAFAMAYLDLASTYYRVKWLSEERDHPFMELAAGYVEQAIRLEPDLAAAHAMLAIIESLRYNWELGYDAYERAVALTNGPLADSSFAETVINWGYLEDHRDILLAWLERDPVESQAVHSLVINYAFTGQLDQVLKYMAIRRELGQRSQGHEISLVLDDGQVELARSLHVDSWGDEPSDVASCIAELCNANSNFRIILEANHDPSRRADYIAAIGAAVKTGFWDEGWALWAFVRLQAADEVFETAQRLWEKRMLNPIAFWQYRGGPIRKDPRFLELMETIGLVDFWKAHGPPDFCEPDGDSFVCN